MSRQGGEPEGSRRKPRPRWLKVVSGGVVALLVAVVAIFAVRHPGRPVHDVALGDGSVWVSGGRTTYWARVNPGSRGFDLVLPGGGSSGSEAGVIRPDVLQDGPHAVGVTSDRSLVPFDTRTGEVLEGRPTVPEPDVGTGQEFFRPDVVDLRGGTIAMVDEATGQVWAKRLDPKGETDLTDFHTGRSPIVTVGGAASLTVDIHGNVKAVSAAHGVVVDVPVEGDGFGAPERTSLGFNGRFADITAIGERWVVMDGESGDIYHEGQDGDPDQIPDGGTQPGVEVVKAALQQPGEDTGRVAVQTLTKAAYVGLDEGSSGEEPEIVAGLEERDPAVRNQHITRPVVTGDCLVAAWGRTHALYYGRLCGEGQAQVSEIAQAGDTGRRNGVAVRYNRGQVVLNDLDTGRVYDISLDTKDVRVDTWPQGAPRRGGGEA